MKEFLALIAFIAILFLGMFSVVKSLRSHEAAQCEQVGGTSIKNYFGIHTDCVVVVEIN